MSHTQNSSKALFLIRLLWSYLNITRIMKSLCFTLFTIPIVSMKHSPPVYLKGPCSKFVVCFFTENTGCSLFWFKVIRKDRSRGKFSLTGGTKKSIETSHTTPAAKSNALSICVLRMFQTSTFCQNMSKNTASALILTPSFRSYSWQVPECLPSEDK